MLETNDALNQINKLHQNYKPGDIDWESTLERGYRLFLNNASTVIDVGAHKGRHSDVFINSIQCQKVYLFEPQSYLCSELENKYSRFDNVICHNIALTNFQGTSSFVFNKNAPQESGLKERIYNNPSKKLEIYNVKVNTLDSLFGGESVSYIKLDTEGAEIDILLGGEKLIERSKPIISAEYGKPSYSVYGYTEKTLFELCQKLQYTIFDLFGNPIEEINTWLKCVNRFYWDYYLVPNSRKQEFNSNLVGRVQPIMKNGRDITQKADTNISKAFPEVEDFIQRTLKLDSENFITQAYQEYLGRKPDLSGKTFYLNQLEEGLLTRKTMIQTFLDSPEYRRNIS